MPVLVTERLQVRLGGYDHLYVDGNQRKGQSWVRLTATQREEELAGEKESEISAAQKADGKQESKGDRSRGNEEAQQLDA